MNNSVKIKTKYRVDVQGIQGKSWTKIGVKNSIEKANILLKTAKRSATLCDHRFRVVEHVVKTIVDGNKIIRESYDKIVQEYSGTQE